MLQRKERCVLNKQIKKLTLAAMLTAMSVVVGIFCKSFLNFGSGLFRVTFENFPIILSGIMLGPIYGAFVGAGADLVSYFLSPQIYPPNLVVTAGAASIGLISGLVSHVLITKKGNAQLIVSGASAHLVGSMIIKPFGLYGFYGIAVLWRIPLYLIIAPLEIMLLCLLYKKQTFKKLFEKL